MPIIKNFTVVHNVDLGPRPERNAIIAGLSSSLDNLQALGYSAAGAFADTVGATGTRDWLNDQADRNQRESAQNGRPDLDHVEDVYDKPSKYLPWAAYQVAQQVPNIAGAIGFGLLAPAAAVPAALSRAAALGPRMLGMGGEASRVAVAAATGGSEIAAREAAAAAGKTFASQVVGGGAFNYAQGAGSLYQESVEGGNPNAGPASLLGAIPYAAAETLPEAMLVGRIGHGAGFKGGLLTRIGKAAGTQAATGATSELLQNEMEMAYHGSVTPEQAASKRLNSGVTGGLVEGLIGGLGGVRNKARASPAPASVNNTPGEATDILQLGHNGYFQQGEGQTPFTVFPDGSTATSADATLMQANGMTPDQLAATRAGGPRIDPTMAAPGAEGVAPYLPGTMVADQGGQVALDATGANALYGDDNGDPGTAEARRRYLAAEDAKKAEVVQQAELKAATDRKKDERVALQARAKSATGMASTKATDLFGDLERQRTAGLIDQDEMASDAALISLGEFPKAASNIKARDKAVLDAREANTAAAGPPAKETPSAGKPAGNGAATAADAGRSAGGQQPGIAGPAVAGASTAATAAPAVDSVVPAGIRPDGNAGALSPAAPVSPHAKYAGRAVSIEVPSQTEGGKATKRRIKDAGKALDEADTRAENYDALVKCLQT